MLDKLKSLFIIEEPGVKEASKLPNQEVNAQSSTATVSQPAETIPSNASTTSQKPDLKFTELLFKAIDDHNQSGFDYLEYKNSIKSLEKVIPDEAMRFQSAFAMAKTMGATKEGLVQSASTYLSVLENEDKKFKEALQNQKTKQIQSRAEQVSQIEKSIQEKQQLIDKLNQEIQAAKEQFAKTKAEIDESVVKIDLTNQQFVASYQLVYGQITGDIEKMKTNL